MTRVWLKRESAMAARAAAGKEAVGGGSVGFPASINTSDAMIVLVEGRCYNPL